ncbi:hypothetical protein ACP4OV_029418 [Aristida adscensionis]
MDPSTLGNSPTPIAIFCIKALNIKDRIRRFWRFDDKIKA